MRNTNGVMIFIMLILGIGIPSFFIAKGLYILVRNDQVFPWLLEKYFLWAAIGFSLIFSLSKALKMRIHEVTLTLRDTSTFKQYVNSAMYVNGYSRPVSEAGLWIYKPRTTKAGFPPFRMTVRPMTNKIKVTGPKQNVERFVRAMRMSGSLSFGPGSPLQS